MKPIKALVGSIKNIPDLHLHILLTEEDDVIVARCLDFSVSSHGGNEDDALVALSDSIKDYLDYALKRGALNEIVDPEDDVLWEIYRKIEMQNESLTIREKADILKIGKIKEVTYA